MQQNYFELFNLPEDFELDEDKLHAAYRACQLKSHPDRLGSLQYSTLLNDAYRTLKDPVKRAHYVLKLQNLSADLETDTHLDPYFLIEQLELREALHELSASSENQDALRHFRNKLSLSKREKIGKFLIAYRAKNYEAARNDVRELQFFCRLDDQVRDLLC
jgi:molecular chaperone HscB